jgi:hypothetical protein
VRSDRDDLISEVKEGYCHLSNTSIDPDRYENGVADVVCDILTVDSFVAGIAASIIEAAHVDHSDAVHLAREFLNENVWTTLAGSSFDLSEFPEILQHARLVVRLQNSCLGLLRNARR